MIEHPLKDSEDVEKQLDSLYYLMFAMNIKKKTSEKIHDENDLGKDDIQLNIHNRQFLMTTNQ